MKWTRADWLNLILFAVLVTLFYWRILTPDAADRQSFPPGDFYAQFWAFTTMDARALSAGRLPLWNPYTFAGAPFWADVQAAVFYPFSLLTLLLSAPWGFSAFALELEAIFHFWLAAAFMYLFVRDITRSRAAAVVAAVTFTFSGYLTGYPSQQLAVLEADVWLPLILFFLYRARTQIDDTGNLRMARFSPQPALMLAGVAWGLTLLAGHPQSALIVGYVSVAYFLFLWLGQVAESQVTSRRSPVASPLTSQAEAHTSSDASRITPHASHFTLHISRITRHVFRLIPPLLLFLLTGLGLAAIQFIPAVEYTLHSVRAEGAYERMSGGLPLPDLIQLLLPGQVSHYSPLYVGVVGLILALGVVWTAPNRHTIFWAALAALALLIAFGGNTFLYSPLYLAAPGFSIFRGQERWAMAFAFSLSVLAGYGFYQLSMINNQLSIKNPLAIRNSQFPLRLTKQLLLFALLLTLASFYGLNDTGWRSDSPFYSLLGAATLLTILLALAWLLWTLAPHLSVTPLTALTVTLICFDLFSVNWQTNLYPQPPEWHTRMPAAVQAIKIDAARFPGEPYRVYNEFRLYDNYGVPFELEDLWGGSPLRPSRYDEFLAPPMPIERTWELLNVKYVITWRQELYLPSTVIYQEPADDGVTYVHRLDTVGPRAWLVSQFEAADDTAILTKIADPNFDRWHIALLETDSEFTNGRMGEWANGRLDESANGEPVDQSQFTIRNSQFPAPGIIIHQVSAPAPALLILSEPDYPGWQATVDGLPAPILRANFVLRAVPVPAGDHTVALRFRPLSFTVGAVLSGLTAAVVIVMLGSIGWQARRGRKLLTPD